VDGTQLGELWYRRNPSDSPYLDPSLLIDTDVSLLSRSHGIYLLLAEDRFYVGKTCHTFKQCWEEHLTGGVCHKVKALMEEAK
jgi:hypothetical protein